MIIFFSLYAAGAAAVLVALTSWFVPEVNSRCSTVDDRTLIYGCNFDLSLNENWLYWATFLAIAVVPFFLGYRVALSRLQISGRIKGWVLLIRGIVPIVLFLIASLITFPLAGFPGVLDLTYHRWLLYGLVLGLIDAISGMYPDLEFVNSNEYDDAVKIARLQQEHEKWASALGMVTVFYIAIAISGLLTLFVGINEILRAPWSNMGFSILLYGSIGLAIGVYRPTFPRSNTFPGYSSRRDAANYNLAFQGRQMRPDSLKFLLSWTNHRPAKRKISKPLVYDQVSSLGSPFALYDPVTVINPDAPKVD